MNWGIMSLRYDQSVARATRLVRAKGLGVYLLAGLVTLGAEVYAAYPEGEFQALTSPQEAKLNEIRDQEVMQIQTILKRSISKEQRADLLLRLGEVYNEKYRYYFFKENQIWNKKIDEFLNAGGKGKKRPKLDAGKSKGYLHQSIKYLEKVLDSIGRYDKLDEVYYYLGFNHWELGNQKKSVGYFQRIVNGYPSSRYLSESHRYLGDYEFANRRFRQALDSYQKAARDKESPTLPKVLYGLAWSQYKNGQNKRALDTIVQAIRLSKTQNEEEAAKRGTSLQNDAYDAMVVFYSEAGSPKEAQKFFEREVGEQATPELLAKLLAIYQKQGRYGEALTTSRQLEEVDESARAEGSTQRYEILNNALKLAQQKRDTEREQGILKTLIAEFVQKDASEEIQESIKNSLRRSAVEAHKESEKAARRKAAEARAIGLYKLYLGTFANKASKEDVYEIHFYLADLYGQAGRHRESAAEFRFLLKAAIEDSGNDYLQKIKRSAAEGVIYALDEYFDRKKSAKLNRQETDELLEAIDAFVQLYPQDKDTPKFVARAAGLLKDQKDREAEYYERLRLLIEKYPGTPQALEAAVLLVKRAEARSDFEGIEKLVTEYLANDRLMAQDRKGTFRAQLEEVRGKAKFKVVKDIEKGNNHAEAAARYEQLARETRDREVRFKALNNAAVNFQRAGDRANELRLYKEIAKAYPDRVEAADRILSVADESFILGNYSEAAEKYEEFYELVENRLGRNAKLQGLAINALRNAAFLRDALNDDDKAVANIKRIVQLANRKIDSARNAAEEFLFERAKRRRQAEDNVEAVNAYKKYLSAFPGGRYSTESMVELARLYTELREPEKAQGYLTKAASRRKGLSRSELGYAAQARLALLGGLEAAYRRSGLNLPEEQLKRDVKAKLQRLEQLNKGYLEVVEYGDGRWALEAFHKMALTYQDFANALENAPVPANYNDEQKAKFQAQLRAVAKPVRLKVVETLNTALRQGESLLVGDPVMAKIYVANVLVAPDLGLPLVQEADWSDAKKWIMGSYSDESGAREALKTDAKNLKALTTVGNAHLVKGEDKFARIYYARALQVNPKYVPALNNLAYLEGKGGNSQAALAGFKQALALREFEIVPKHNVAKIYMASGLWRHANLAFRQLEVRAQKDDEILRGLGLSYLAMGKLDKAREYLSGRLGSDLNGRYAKAVLELAGGDKNDARSSFGSLADRSEYARMVVEYWRR